MIVDGFFRVWVPLGLLLFLWVPELPVIIIGDVGTELPSWGDCGGVGIADDNVRRFAWLTKTSCGLELGPDDDEEEDDDDGPLAAAINGCVRLNCGSLFFEGSE